MATAAENLKQELPPNGGYRPLNFERTFPKKFNSIPKFFGLVFGAQGVWHYYWKKNKREVFVSKLENRSANIGIEPALAAERDRAYLRQLRKNRDEEEELMKDYPGWVTGTYYGEPIFKTMPDDFLIDPDLTEYYIHTRFRYLIEYWHTSINY